MISEDELFNMSCEEFEDGHSRDCWREGFRASEKIYLAQIAELEARIKSARECIEVYGDINNWQTNSGSRDLYNAILDDDLENRCWTQYSRNTEVGGKRAREFLRGLDGE
jgi:hypothetical protein